MGFALWAFSIFGVPRSAIITDAFAALVLRICTATSVVWANAGSMTPQQAAQRLLAGGSAHLLVAAIVIVGVLFLKVTLSNWIKVSSPHNVSFHCLIVLVYSYDDLGCLFTVDAPTGSTALRGLI